MAEYVRVRDKETGHHYTVTRDRFERTPDLWQQLKQPATNSVGDPLPPKCKTTVAAAASEKADRSAKAVESDK